MVFDNQTIVIISQQPMGEMFLSKHHYAIELVSRGNRVYFLNPPDQKQVLSPGTIHISSTRYDGLFQIDHRLWIPFATKFHAKGLYDVYMKWQVRRILNRIGTSVDLIWSFDISDTIPLRCFPEEIKKIFMPVDWPYGPISINAAKAADHIFSISPEILNCYAERSAPKHYLHHGVHPVFTEPLEAKPSNGHFIRVGLSGNFARPDLDRNTLMHIFRGNPSIQFECWGNYAAKNSNMGDAGDADAELDAFIQTLMQLSNVVMHGPVSFQELAVALKNMDAFLIGYDVRKDQSRGTNYHKVMEYLSIGKVIISNRIQAYQNTDLVEMVEEEHNQQLPILFQTVIQQLDRYNHPNLVEKRRKFGAEHTYARQLDLIESLI